MKKACVYFHQGWTDIIMCLALINYYKAKYDEIYVLIRSDAKGILDYYVRTLEGVHIVYIKTDNGRFYGGFQKFDGEQVEYLENGSIAIPNGFDIMFHAEHDMYRDDKYKHYWYQPNKKPTRHFSEAFYLYYDIDFSVRVDYFGLDRDLDLEDETYQEFIKNNGKDYIVFHDDEINSQHGSHHISTKIEFVDKIEGVNYINLNKKSKIFFDYIKIIQNAKEIHLVDSIWAAVCYQLDTRYGLFKDKKIKVYCKRGHQQLFSLPVKLENWELI